VYQDHYHIEEYEETEVKTNSTRMNLLVDLIFTIFIAFKYFIVARVSVLPLVLKYWDNENNY
jgi:hypothetical protein